MDRNLLVLCIVILGSSMVLSVPLARKSYNHYTVEDLTKLLKRVYIQERSNEDSASGDDDSSQEDRCDILMSAFEATLPIMYDPMMIMATPSLASVFHAITGMDLYNPANAREAACNTAAFTKPQDFEAQFGSMFSSYASMVTTVNYLRSQALSYAGTFWFTEGQKAGYNIIANLYGSLEEAGLLDL